MTQGRKTSDQKLVTSDLRAYHEKGNACLSSSQMPQTKWRGKKGNYNAGNSAQMQQFFFVA